MRTQNYKRFLDDRLLIFCLGCSLLLVGECFVKAERFPYKKVATRVGTHIGKLIDDAQYPERTEDKLVQQQSGSYDGDFDFPSQR